MQSSRRQAPSTVIVVSILCLAATNSLIQASNFSSSTTSIPEHPAHRQTNQSADKRNGQSSSRRKFDGQKATEKRPVLELGANFLNRDQLEAAESFYFQRNTHRHETVSGFVHSMLEAKLISQPYSDFFIHRYDSDGSGDQLDIGRAAGPQVNQELCLSQLEYLNRRAEESLERGPQSRDVNLADYIDTFGGSPTGKFVGNFFSVGSYEACKRTQISLAAAQGQRRRDSSAARYCIGSLRYKDWLTGDPLEEVLALKTGLCLPASCDSLDYKNKFGLIKRLNDYVARPTLDRGLETELTGLYCPPDERSELGSWWRSRPTLLTVGLACAWLLVLIGATAIDEFSIQTRVSLARVCRSLSILNNLRLLFRTAGSDRQQQKHQASADGHAEQSGSGRGGGVNLDVLEGIKVLAALHIMSGHSAMLAGSVLSNYREVGPSNALAWILTNMTPCFAVNAFFAISGILNSYLIFSRDPSGNTLIKQPLKWLALVVFRYLRLMPVYALVSVFCKHVARFIGDGPLWDHGTSSLAARRSCQQESWAWTLLLGANFKSPFEHCIPSAWYLANDFQFFLVTPIFVLALHLRPRLGKRLLVSCALAGYFACVCKMFTSEAHDLRPVFEFMPHGLMLFVNHLHESYTRPQFRIPAYLVGLLMGYLLHEHERERARLERPPRDEASSRETAKPNPPTSWPEWMTSFGPLFAAAVLVATFSTPYWSMGGFTRGEARFLGATVTPTLHLLNSLATGLYILLAATGHGNQLVNRLLSFSFWKPLARLGLCAMLVNVEVGAYLTQTARTTNHFDNYFLSSLSVMVFIYSHLIAAIVHVLFEAPIRAILDAQFAAHFSAPRTQQQHHADKNKNKIKSE